MSSNWPWPPASLRNASCSTPQPRPRRRSLERSNWECRSTSTISRNSRRVDEAIARVGDHRSNIGVRLNPQTGAGAIGAMSTATSTSKFGIGLADHRERVIEAFASRPWLTQLHVHSGSQGLSLSHAAEGVRLIADLAQEITVRVGRQQIQRIDIGGGLPVNFDSDDITPTFFDHRAVLEAAAPALFDGTYTLVTEFGRALTAKAGTIVARVEYTKVSGGRPIAITHAGVQVATRTIFAPDAWPLRIDVYDPLGRRREEEPQVQDVAGPACFTGDMLAVGRESVPNSTGRPGGHPGDRRLLLLHPLLVQRAAATRHLHDWIRLPRSPTLVSGPPRPIHRTDRRRGRRTVTGAIARLITVRFNTFRRIEIRHVFFH